MTVTDDYLANNAEYAKSFQGPLPLPPSKHVAVVACMDARLDVHSLLGIEEGEAHVIRSAGGVVTDDAIRSLAISQRLLGTGSRWTASRTARLSPSTRRRAASSSTWQPAGSTRSRSSARSAHEGELAAA